MPKKKSLNKLGVFLVFFIIVLFSFSFLFFSQSTENITKEIAQAAFYTPPATGDNASGWAWSSNIGWISFNSTSCDSNCPVGGPCISDGSPFDCPAAGTSYPDYGVKIDSATGDFSGYAWSSNIGWISFNRTDTGNPPEDPFQSGSGAIAKMDIGNHYGLITGWAQALSLGNNGWIRFSYAPDSGYFDSITFPITNLALSGTNYATYVNASEKTIHGWAWNASSTNSNPDGIGWISFNCDDYFVCSNDRNIVCSSDDDCGGGSCATACDYSNYKVSADVNTPPGAINLNAPNWSTADACNNNTGLAANLRWSYSDDNGAGTAYRVVVAKNSNTEESSPAGDIVFDSGKCSAIGGNCKIADLSCLQNGNVCRFPLDASNGIEYGASYTWWVLVWDSIGIPAVNWAQYSAGTDQPISTDDGKQYTFTTYLHDFPEAVIPNTWFPQSPSKDEETIFFSDGSSFGNSSENCFSTVCTDTNPPYGSLCCSYKWTPTDGNIVGVDNASSTIIKFNKPGTNGGSVKLEVTDNDNYTCEMNVSLDVKKKLPKWIETK